MEKVQAKKVAMFAAVVGLSFLITEISWATRSEFLRSYLYAFLCWSQIPLGCLSVFLMFNLTEGAWGETSGPYLKAGARTFWPLALLLIPVLFGVHDLYPWARPEEVAKSIHLQHKKLYLNVPFFTVRAAVYMVVWIFLARLGTRKGAAVNRRKLSAAGLIILGVTITFAAIDWSMSLEPEWFSTIYGLLAFASDGLSAFAWGIVMMGVAVKLGWVDEARFSPKALNDLGNLLLAFVMIWAYLSFFQYLIIWSGNLPEDTSWYIPRSRGGWQWVVGGIGLFQFGAPFTLLLFKRFKKNISNLGKIALLTLVLRFVDTFWWVIPAFRPERFSVRWTDIAALLGVGGLWLAAFLLQLEKGRQLSLLEAGGKEDG
jgi:hypothetical protein